MALPRKPDRPDRGVRDQRNHRGRHRTQPRQSWRHQWSACLYRHIHAYRERAKFPHRIACHVADDADYAISDLFSVDTARPTVVNASIAKSDLRLGETTTINITFSDSLAI